MALRFGLEFDLRQIEKDTPGFIYTEYFHTMMYLKFATYITKVSKDKALIAATELLKDTFKIRVAAHYKNKEDIIQLTPAGYGMFSKAEYVGKAGQILKNGGPFMISERLYTMILEKDGINKLIVLLYQKATELLEKKNLKNLMERINEKIFSLLICSMLLSSCSNAKKIQSMKAS